MSWIVRIELPIDLALPAREAFSELASRIASRFSFLGMEDWAVDLGAQQKVLGVEREFHDLTGVGKMNSSLQFYFARKDHAASFGKIVAHNVDGIRVLAPRKQVRRDWMKEWRKHYKTQVIEESEQRLAIVPAWKKAPARGVSVKIWPGQAFGTGTHPTTRLCLRFLLRSGFSEGRVLDFGAGTGVLAMAAAKLGKKISAVAVESDPEALAQCGKNARLNRVKLKLCRKAPKGTYDFVFANVLAPVLLAERDLLFRSLKTSGLLVLSGLLAKEGDNFWREFSGSDFHLVERLDEGDWCAIMARRKK
jgi:ribosomal protein L11 methyltransferase